MLALKFVLKFVLKPTNQPRYRVQDGSWPNHKKCRGKGLDENKLGEGAIFFRERGGELGGEGAGVKIFQYNIPSLNQSEVCKLHRRNRINV